MGTPPLLTDKEARVLQALVEEGVEFLVVGLAAAALQGAPAVTQDIDLWFRDLSDPALQRALRRVGAIYIPPSLQNPPLLAGGDAGLFDVVVNMHGLGSFAQEVRRALRIRSRDPTGARGRLAGLAEPEAPAAAIAAREPTQLG